MGGYFIAETKPAIMTAEKTMFKSRNIPLNVVGIHLLFTKGDTARSGDTYS
jgi:hypothetical protein